MCKKLMLVILILLLGLSGAVQAIETITVSGTPWGVSTEFIGADEGNANFDINDLLDLGINNYRIWGDMSRWEWEDDDGVYGSPTIAEIKANPDVINWAWWDTAMTTPLQDRGTNWSLPNMRWQSDAMVFQALKSNGIRPVVTLRNQDNYMEPGWSPNPPVTAADWNEWWEFVFAAV